jgi:hypothetical protein
MSKVESFNTFENGSENVQKDGNGLLAGHDEKAIMKGSLSCFIICY